MTSAPELLHCRECTLTIGQRNILKGVSWQIHSGEAWGLLGANGAGKSSLMKVWMGLQKANAMFLSFKGSEWHHKVDLSSRRQQGLAYLAQEHWLFEDMSVIDNLLTITELLGWNAREAESKITALLDKMGLQTHHQQLASSLSGGEKKRLEIARLLLESPSMIMLDEPFAGLDPKSIRLLKDVLLQLQDEGITTLVSDHQFHHLLDICSSVVLMHEGEKLLSCSADEVQDHPIAKDLYL